MSLDRDELAARYFAVLLTPLADDGPAQEWDMGKMAGAAVEAADALLAALVPVAPASAAPLAAPSRPEWVRITSLNNGSWQPLTVGKVYAVAGWDEAGRAPRVLSDEQRERYLSSEGEKPDPKYPTFASWEPCAAPSPAATPAAWVPSVGDVVGIDGGKEYDETRVVTKIDRGAVSYVRLNANGGVICGHTTDVSLLTYLRRATSSERAAAGLPVDESAGDEAEEREAARVAYWKENTVVCSSRNEATYIAGWLARARVAAKGGAS